MSEVVKKPLKITESVLRDAHQSLIAITTSASCSIAPDSRRSESIGR